MKASLSAILNCASDFVLSDKTLEWVLYDLVLGWKK